MPPSRYDAHGIEAEFEPGSRGRVLRNKLGIRRGRDMEQAESEALQAGLPPLDFSPMAGRNKAGYIAAIHAALGGLWPHGSPLCGGHPPDFEGFRGAALTVLAGAANGLRMPSTADELAADTRNAASRLAGSRSQGFCWSKEVAMGMNLLR